MLQLIEVEDFYEGNQSIRINFDGFDIPAADESPELLEFNVKTFYSFMKARSTEAAYGIVNNFFRTLSLDEQKEVASTLMMANGLLKQAIENSAALYATLDECADLIYELDAEINLCPRIDAYVKAEIREKRMPIADMSDVGKGPHHRKSMTFHQEEAEIITAVTVLCKMFSPVVGELIRRHTALIPVQMRESACCMLYTPVFNRRYREIINKIIYYVDTLVQPKGRNDLVGHYRGFTPTSTTWTVSAMILAKKSVSIDLYKPDGSVIKYIASCVKSYLDSQQKSTPSNNYQVKPFADPKDGDISGNNEETNNSRIEIESTHSKKPSVIIPLIKFTAQHVIDSQIATGMVPKEKYEDILQFYTTNPVIISHIGIFIIATYFGPELGGSRSVHYLDGIELTRLAAVIQYLAATNNLPHLAHAMTMKTSLEERAGQVEDFAFTNSWKSTPEYAECRKSVTAGFGEVAWDTQLKDIVQLLTAKVFMYHTAPAIWGILGETEKNGRAFINHQELMTEILILVRDLWKLRSNPRELLGGMKHGNLSEELR